ncbi:uncharacterized protein LOC115212170 isoform X2 [Octopus sinensis]|uniref:Uncharacterized protein LOC115212170 isoform X2 n=1 Tax=Octopus sinensis TaxID=2607531 RepID=A0A7E6EV16_9MOLL|nr:uncharacterized protein LOC115212170 isoform X2 [Octopus sinensis]
MVSSDDIFKTSQLLIIIFWIIFNSQVQCHKLPPDSSSELLPSYSLPSSLFTIFDKSKDDRTSGILMYFKDDASSVETSVNLFSSFTQAQTKSFLQQYQLEVLLSPSSSSYFQSSSSILLSSNNLQTNGPSISLASSLVTACLSISMFNSLTANIEDPNNLHSIGISQTEFVSEGDSSISDMFNPYFQPLDNFFPVSNSLLLDSTSQILKSILALENLNDSMALENFPVLKMKPLMKEQNINQSKFDSQIYTISTGVSSLNINSRLLNINTSYVYSFKQQPHTQINSDSPFDEMMSESQIFSSSFALKSSQPYISPIFQTTSKLLSETQTRSDFDLNAKQYFTQKNFYSLSTLKDLITKKSGSTETENLHGALIIYSTQQMLWANSKTESMSPYKCDQTKLFVLHPSQSQISQIDEIESLYPINKNQIFLYNDHFLGSFQSAISQSYLSPFKHFTTNERPFSDLKFSLSGNTFASVNDPASSTFRRPITNSLESNSLHQPKFIKLTISQLISAYFDESQIHFDSKELLYMATAAAISEIPQQQAKWLSNSFNFQKSFHNNLYQSIIPMSHFNDNQSLLPSLKSEIWDVSNEFWKSKLEPVIMKSPEANLFGSNSDNLVPTLRHRTTDIVNPTQSMLQYFLENLYTESMTIDEFDTKESPHLSNTEILEPSEAVSLVNVEDLLLRTLQNIFPSFVSLGKTNTDTSFTSSSEELFHLLNSGLSFHTQPSHSMELLQPSTHTYIPITDLSELSLASSQIQMPLSFQSPVNFDLMNKFSSPNMIFYSDSEQILQTSPENFQPSLTMTKSNVFSEGHDSYVYDSLRSKLEIITAPKDSFDKTQSYSNHVISSHIPELIDSYSSSSTLEIPENIYFSKSLLPLTSLKNLISTSLTPEVIYSNPFLPNSIQFDDPKFSLYSLEIIEISSMIDQFTQELPLITPPVFGNTIESNFKYSPTTSTSSQSSDFISSTENGNTSILASSYSSNSVNPVYDSSMINVAVTNFTMHNSLVSTLHSDIDYQLESIYSSSESVYLYSSQIPLFVLSSFISEDKESNHLIPEFSYLYSSQTSMLVSSSFISKDNSNPKSSSNISNSSLFTSSNLTLSSKQMATLLISNYTLASINTNTSTKQESLNNNNSETKRISNLLTATESSSMQKTEFYVSTSSVLEMSSRNMQLNNSLYFQHFWIVTIIKVRSDIDVNSFEFKHGMEERLARSYVEAYKRGEHILNGTYRPLRKKRFAVVKDIALQIMKIVHFNHGTSQNVSLVYYMEKNGRPVPAKDAIKHMNLIQLQELAIYLNHVVVLRAEAYLKTPDGKYTENWIIGVVLGSVAVVLLFMWCVLFIFFKCFRHPPLKIQEVKPINSCLASSLQEIKCNPELVPEDLISKKENQRSLEERDSLKNQNEIEKHYVKIPLEEMSKPKNIKKSSNKKSCKIVSEEQEVPVKNKKLKAKLAQSVGSTKDYDEKPLKFGNFDQNMEKSKNNEDVSSSCYVNLPPIPSHISLVATKPKFDKACCERRQNLQQQELQMQQDLSPNELYINLNAECEEIGCAECNRSNYTRKNKRKVFKQRKCNLRHASDVNSFKESSLNELYDDDKLWRRQPDTLQQTCVKMHNLLDDAFQLISMNLPQQNLKPFMSQSFHEPNHEMQHVPKYSQYQQCKCAPQLGYSRYNISPSWNKAGDELSKISSDEAWIPFMAPNKDCFDHKHSEKPLMHSTQHFPENHKEKNLIPGINNFCCSTQSSTYYFPHLSNSTSYSAARHQLCPHRQVATSLDISTNQLRTIGSKIPNFSSKNSNKISTVQQFSRFSPQTSSSNQSFLRQKISQKATDDEIDAIYKNIKPNTSQPLIQSIREELMTASAYNNEINSFNILE